MKKPNCLLKSLILLSMFFVIEIADSLADAQAQANQKDLDKIEYQTKKFRAVMETIYKNYDDSVNIEKLSNRCFNAMLNSLDPFSHYFSPDEYKALNEEQKGSSESIGLSLFSLYDTLTVINVTKNSPADTAGILPGDMLLSIDGKSVIAMTVNAANDLLRGKLGTETVVSIKRFKDNSIVEYKLNRKEIEIPSITCEFVFPKSDIAYIKMMRFSQKSYIEFCTSMDTLIAQGAKSLILDLRDNAGGFLDIVIKINKELVKKGQLVTIVKSNSKLYDAEYKAENDGKYSDIPIVVLMNENSASASEILAGMVQDLDRGLVVGRISLGKGLVQKYWNYTDTSAFRITVAKYYTPSGRMIQKDYQSDAQKSAIDPAMTMNMDEATKNQIEEIMKLTGGKTQLPVYKTSKGRVVFGGGGIFPDLISKLDTNTVLYQVLKSKGVYLEYGLDIYKKFSKDLYEKFPTLNSYIFNYSVSEGLLENFVAYFRSKNIWNEQMYKTDKEAIRNFLKSNIGFFLWGDPAFYGTEVNYDKQMIDAIKQMPEARNMLK